MVAGRNLRPKPKHTLVLTPQARIVTSVTDSTRDRFIPRDVAKRMFDEGKLTEIDLGPDYPDTYMSTE
jgi:hypothetical protein